MKKIFFALLITIFIVGCAAPEKKIGETVFYPPLPQTPRLQFLTSISSEDDLGKKQSAFDEFLLGKLPESKRIIRPLGIGSSKNHIYVLDRETRSVINIDLNKKIFDLLQSSSHRFPNPAGIWIAEDNFKYIADQDLKQIVVYDDENKFSRSYGKNILDKPIDVAVYGEKVYACDFNLNMVIVFDKNSGDVVQRIGEIGKDEGLFLKPSHITVDHEGNLYVNDAFNYRIQKFDAFGSFISVYGFHGDTVGGFARPKGIVVSREGHLYVVDAAFENVQIFDTGTSDILLFFGGYGRAGGDMYLPSAIHIDYENLEHFQKYADKDFRLQYLVYVGNQYGSHKVNVYGFGEWKGAPLIEHE